MKIIRSTKVRFTDGQAGAAIAAHIKIQSSNNRISRINRDGIIYIHLTAKSNPEIASVLAAFISSLLKVEAARIEVVGKDESPDRLITGTGMPPPELQQKIVPAAG